MGRKPLKADGADAVFVYATITDKNGNPINDGKIPVTFELEVGGSIVGQNPMLSEAGVATILVQSTNVQ